MVSGSCGFSGNFGLNRKVLVPGPHNFRNPFSSPFFSLPDPERTQVLQPTRPGFSGHLRPTQTTAPVGFSSSPPSELPCGGDMRRFSLKSVTRSSEARVRDPVGFLPPAAATRQETGRERRPLASWFDFGWPWSATHDGERRWWILSFPASFRRLPGRFGFDLRYTLISEEIN
ncbi:hypothetical protein ACLB2K_073172 [Fragaria x ananassa]